MNTARISTSSYSSSKGIEKTISISSDSGTSIGYIGPYFSELAPKERILKIWRDNIGKLDEIENKKLYVKNYVNEILINLDAFDVFEKIDGFTLLSYEESIDRHIVGYWLEDRLGIMVPDIKCVEGKIIRLPRPKYIKELYDLERHVLLKD